MVYAPLNECSPFTQIRHHLQTKKLKGCGLGVESLFYIELRKKKLRDEEEQ
jgi:hypothetical protein